MSHEDQVTGIKSQKNRFNWFDWFDWFDWFKPIKRIQLIKPIRQVDLKNQFSNVDWPSYLASLQGNDSLEIFSTHHAVS
jgi:hypothetical protein